MKQSSRIISTYSADTMGVCSALFELGGMIIMHDASGCNSTYTTHDEPRWYDMDSMVFISALTEMDAIMGNDEKLLADIEDAVREFHPKFVAIAGTPIPTMTGFDFESVARLAEFRTGIPCMGFATTGMNTYIHGASMAFEEIARRFVKAPGAQLRSRRGDDSGGELAGAEYISKDGAASAPKSGSAKPRVNIIGLTPLDFSVNGQDKAIAAWLEAEGFEIVSKWAMGNTLEDIARSAEADVNLVVSAAGLRAAEYMYEKYGIPYISSLPIGKSLSYEIEEELSLYDELSGSGSLYKDVLFDMYADKELVAEGSIVIIGEAVASLALASAIEISTGKNTKVLCATETMGAKLREKDRVTPDEEDIINELRELHEKSELIAVIADPLYRPIVPADAKFIPLPSEAFSGRLYRAEIPNLITDFDSLLERLRV